MTGHILFGIMMASIICKAFSTIEPTIISSFILYKLWDIIKLYIIILIYIWNMNSFLFYFTSSNIIELRGESIPVKQEKRPEKTSWQIFHTFFLKSLINFHKFLIINAYLSIFENFLVIYDLFLRRFTLYKLIST